MEEFLEKVYFGLKARLQTGERNQQQHYDLAEFHHKELSRLQQKCEKVFLLGNSQGLQKLFKLQNVYNEHFFYVVAD